MTDIIDAVDPIKKVVSMGDRRYNTQKTIEDEEKELEELIKQQTVESENRVPSTDELEPPSPEEKTFKKRYGDLRRHTQKQQKDYDEKISVLQKQLDEITKAQIQLPKTEQELDKWAEEYPDVAAIIETIAIKKSQEQSQDLESKMEKLNQLQLDAQREKAEAELLTLHPDFETIRVTDEFHKWAEEQPKWVQDALYENEADARSAARAIDLYKADKNLDRATAQKTTKTKKILAAKEAATAIDTKPIRQVPETNSDNNKWRESLVERMSPEQYEKHADEIMEAIRAGEFLYDISGAAR